MRKHVSVTERRKAMRLVEQHTDGTFAHTPWSDRPGYLGKGWHNVVYALTADLVVRIEKVAYSDDTSWGMYSVAQIAPHPQLPTVWELGVTDGYRWAVVERLQRLNNAGREYRNGVLFDAIQPAVGHLCSTGSASYVHDIHEDNLMWRRGKRDRTLVLTDCLLEI